jgi:3-hydroxybutyrate dehydrogenase
MPSLTSRAALVTGSTSGIGLAIARALAAEGADITLNGLGEPGAIDRERAAIEREFGVACRYSDADMMDGAAITTMVEEAQKAFGSLDILVNNAGIQHVAPIDAFPDDKFEAIIRINLVSLYYSTKAAIPMMREKGWGRIINTASAHALVASPFKSAYVAAKHGVAGLTKTVALETAQDGITVNAIAPGYVWTPLVEKQIPDTMKARGMTAEEVKETVMLAAQPTKAFVTPEQIGAVAVFLCSDAASQITGTTLPVDGGWTAQ